MTHSESIPYGSPAGPAPSDDLARNMRWLRSLAIGLVRDEASADDLAQEAWLAMERSKEPQPRRAVGYLRNLARRRARGESRRTLREKHSAQREAIPSAAELAAGLESQRILLEELQALPPASSELLLLRAREQMSAVDIARAKGVPASTIRDRLRRAEALLRDRLDERHGGQRRAWTCALIALPATSAKVGLAGAGASASSSAGAFFGLLLTMNTTLKTILIAAPIVLSAWLFMDRGDDVVSPESESARAKGSAPSQLVVEDVQKGQLSGRQAMGAPAAAARGKRIPVALHVIDAATREPAAWYTLSILDADDSEIAALETDARGRAEIPEECLPVEKGQLLRLLAVDHPELNLSDPAHLELTPEDLLAVGPAIEWELPVGPSYLLSFENEPPAGVTAFLSSTGFMALGAIDRLATLGAPIREGSMPWVRFDPAVASKSTPGKGPWFVRVSDQKGHWQAVGKTTSRLGRAPEVVAMEGGPYGLLTARVTVDGLLPTSSVHVDLQRTGEWLGAPHSVRTPIVSPKGGYQAGQLEQSYLTPGTWTARITGDGLMEIREEFEVRAGESTHQNWDLARASGTHSLRVLVKSESGQAPMRFVSASARPVAGTPGGTKSGADDPDADLPPGERAIRIDGLTPGRWIVKLHHTSNLGPFDPGLEVEVDAHQGDVRFTCLDRDVDWRPTNVELYDATTEEPIQSASVNLWVDGTELVSMGTVNGGAAMPPIFPGLTYELSAQAPGYRAVLLSAALHSATGDGPIRIPMERGWGTLLIARALEPGNVRPLEAVTVIADGTNVGQTDALGRLLLTSESTPTTLKFERDGWTYQVGGVDLATGALTSPHQARATNLIFKKD